MAEEKYPQGSTLKELTDFVAHLKLSGMPVDRIVRQLVLRGWPEASARQFVANVKVTVGGRDAGRDAKRDVERTAQQDTERGAERSDSGERQAVQRQSRYRILRGLICIVLGMVIIVVGLHMGDVYKGLYHFAMGVLLCIFEMIDFITGLTGWWRNRG